MIPCGNSFFDDIVAPKVAHLDTNTPLLNWIHFKNKLPLPPEYNVYNTENLNLKLSGAYKKFLDGAKKVFDYSELNLAHYPRAEYFKLEAGIYRELVRNRPTIDVLFYGLVTNRRQALLNNLRHHGLTVISISNAGRKALWEIDKSKIVLSLGAYGCANNDSWRTIPAIEVGAQVLAEKTLEPEYDEYIESLGATVVNYDELVSKALYLCSG